MVKLDKQFIKLVKAPEESNKTKRVVHNLLIFNFIV